MRSFCAILYKVYNIFPNIHAYVGTAVAQWLRCCVTNRKVAGSIPAGVSGFLIDKKPSDRTMALGWS